MASKKQIAYRVLLAYAAVICVAAGCLLVGRGQDVNTTNNSMGPIQGMGNSMQGGSQGQSGMFTFNANAGVQSTILTMNDPATSVSFTFNVINADFVSVTYQGSTCANNGANRQCLPADCAATDVSGLATTQPCAAAFLGTSKISQTQVQVTANRFSAGGGNTTLYTRVQVMDLNPQFVSFVARGTVSSSGVTITSCPNALRGDLSWLGSSGQDINQFVNWPSSNSIVGLNGPLGSPTWVGISSGYQLICWNQ